MTGTSVAAVVAAVAVAAVAGERRSRSGAPVRLEVWPMSDENLAVYVNDHLAGAVGALRLCDRMVRRDARERPRSGARDHRRAEEVRRLRAAIAQDRDTLQELRRRLALPPSRVRELGAVLLHALSRAKLRLEARRRGELHVLHALDSLALGIEGKKALWSALEACAEDDPRVRVADYAALARRADEQLEALRPLRAQAARTALVPGEN